MHKEIALASLFVFTVCAPGIAGTTGVLNGYVRDVKGQAVAGARIRAMSPADICTAQTGKDGFFSCLNLPPDAYYIDIESGHYRGIVFGLRINSDQTSFVNFKFSAYPRCPTIMLATLSMDHRSAQFDSVNVRQTEMYPARQAPPIFVQPPPARLGALCL